MARLDFHALNVVTHDLHWGNIASAVTTTS